MSEEIRRHLFETGGAENKYIVVSERELLTDEWTMDREFAIRTVFASTQAFAYGAVNVAHPEELIWATILVEGTEPPTPVAVPDGQLAEYDPF